MIEWKKITNNFGILIKEYTKGFLTIKLMEYPDNTSRVYLYVGKQLVGTNFQFIEDSKNINEQDIIDAVQRFGFDIVNNIKSFYEDVVDDEEYFGKEQKKGFYQYIEKLGWKPYKTQNDFYFKNDIFLFTGFNIKEGISNDISHYIYMCPKKFYDKRGNSKHITDTLYHDNIKDDSLRDKLCNMEKLCKILPDWFYDGFGRVEI
jgi:hypothetical protein